MSYLKHSLPGISFAVCIMLIGLYGIYQASDFNQNKNSAEDIKLVNNYEANDSLTVEYLPPIDTFSFAIPKQQPKKESNVPGIEKGLQKLFDGIAKNSRFHKDSVKKGTEK